MSRIFWFVVFGTLIVLFGSAVLITLVAGFIEIGRSDGWWLAVLVYWTAFCIFAAMAKGMGRE